MPKAKPKPPPADFAADFAAEPPAQTASAPQDAAAGEPEILARLEAPSKWSLALVGGGLLLAAGLGVFAIRGAMKKGGRAEG